MRICSFLPSATEIACVLGLEESIRGRSHECDYPPSIQNKPTVVEPLIDIEGRSPGQIDAAVKATMHEKGTIYIADEARLLGIEPELVLTQDLCRVCAPTGEDLNAVAAKLPGSPRILSLNPKRVEDILQNIQEVGNATDTSGRAEEVVKGLRGRIEAVRSRARDLPRPKVFMFEWIDPVFASGHWIPEMVGIAGGDEVLGKAGAYSREIVWDEVVHAAPEVICAIPCGYHLDRSLEQAADLPKKPGWDRLPAVRNGRVFVLDADSYFIRPGPRIVDGIELLAHLLHPEHFAWDGPADAMARL